MSARPSRQRGVALLTALLVVALATVAAVAMVSRQQVDIRRTENLLDADQIRFYLYGIEGWAGKILEKDRQDNNVDDLGEAWATHLPPIPVENGQLTGYIADAQGLFNLNNLVNGDTVSAVDLQRFRRLLAGLNLQPSLADAVVDWIDSDVNPTVPDGAEDDYYLGLTPAHRAADHTLTQASELMAVKGFDAATYRALAPYVVALPKRTDINLNTAPAQVIMTLADGITLDAAKQFVANRPTKGYASVDAALQAPLFGGRNIQRIGLSVASSYFVIMSDIRFGRLEQRFRSLLVRADNGATTVIARSQLYL